MVFPWTKLRLVGDFPADYPKSHRFSQRWSQKTSVTPGVTGAGVENPRHYKCPWHARRGLERLNSREDHRSILLNFTENELLVDLNKWTNWKKLKFRSTQNGLKPQFFIQAHGCPTQLNIWWTPLKHPKAILEYTVYHMFGQTEDVLILVKINTWSSIYLRCSNSDNYSKKHVCCLALNSNHLNILQFHPPK